MTTHALVIASYGRQFLVRTDTHGGGGSSGSGGSSGGGGTLAAVTRGKRTDPAVGDRVAIRVLGADQAVIERIEPRRNELKRSDAFRTKWLAANVDQLGIVIAADPPFSEEILLRILMASEEAGIPAALLVNKSDLTEARARIEPRIACYRALGYRVFDLSAHDAAATRALLAPWLSGRTTLLLGQSGMGKSTLVNALVPDALLRTQTISAALATGRHTTTFTRLFQVQGEGLAPDTALIDSPGFQSFGLEHLSESQRAHAMPEYRPLLGRCRFHNCSHRAEPGCAIRAAAEAGSVDGFRYRLFARLVDEYEASARAFSAPARRPR